MKYLPERRGVLQLCDSFPFDSLCKDWADLIASGHGYHDVGGVRVNIRGFGGCHRAGRYEMMIMLATESNLLFCRLQTSFTLNTHINCVNGQADRSRGDHETTPAGVTIIICR